MYKFHILGISRGWFGSGLFSLSTDSSMWSAAHFCLYSAIAALAVHSDGFERIRVTQRPRWIGTSISIRELRGELREHHSPLLKTPSKRFHTTHTSEVSVPLSLSFAGTQRNPCGTGGGGTIKALVGLGNAARSMRAALGVGTARCLAVGGRKPSSSWNDTKVWPSAVKSWAMISGDAALKRWSVFIPPIDLLILKMGVYKVYISFSLVRAATADTWKSFQQLPGT